ncbi:MAG TPA: hypothetical protein VKD67_14770 [Acidimicrobiales bacterium]|nr:hypothetical protein [Acidimicrobiales bacterium]
MNLPASAKARLGILAGGLVLLILIAAVVAVFRQGSARDVEKAAAAPTGSVPGGGVFTVNAYEGLGTWVDVFDFVPAYQQGGVAPTITAVDVDTMAALGVKTIFLQAARNDARTPDGIVAPDLLRPFLEKAHAHRMKVVGWYYPNFSDVNVDLDRLLQIVRFDAGGQRFDGVAVDIEDNQAVADPAERSARLVDLSKRLREAVGPHVALGAIVMPAVQTEVVNRLYWPTFPWAELKPYFDVWLPMAYWSFRQDPYHSGYTYVTESVRRMRDLVGDPNLKVHPIGGIADKISEGEVRDFVRALTDTDALGGSLYDYRTTPGGVWGVLRGVDAALQAPPGPTTTLPEPTTVPPPAP